MTTSDVSAFMAFGKRFSVDIKLHGLGFVIKAVQYECAELNYDHEMALVEILIPDVIALSRLSESSQIRTAGERLSDAHKSMKYSRAHLIMLLGDFVISANR